MVETPQIMYPMIENKWIIYLINSGKLGRNGGHGPLKFQNKKNVLDKWKFKPTFSNGPQRDFLFSFLTMAPPQGLYPGSVPGRKASIHLSNRQKDVDY